MATQNLSYEPVKVKILKPCSASGHGKFTPGKIVPLPPRLARMLCAYGNAEPADKSATPAVSTPAAGTPAAKSK